MYIGTRRAWRPLDSGVERLALAPFSSLTGHLRWQIGMCIHETFGQRAQTLERCRTRASDSDSSTSSKVSVLLDWKIAKEIEEAENGQHREAARGNANFGK